jgi:predicted DNA-binding transcriptional regulator YafY
MARNEQLIRQHKILQVLERVRFGKTLEELRQDVVDELGLTSIHVRTLRRDLEALQSAGFDVDSHDTPRGKVWKLGPLAKAPAAISVTSTELIALFLGRQLLFPLAGTPFWMGIESFWKKIQEELPAPVLEHYERYRRTLRVLGVPAKNYERFHGTLGTIHRAILEHRVLEIQYHSLDKPATTRRIEPYAVVLFQSSLYVIAAASELATDAPDRVRAWKLDRFQKAVALDTYFRVPVDLDIDQFVGNSLGMFVGQKARDFRIRISAHAARWVTEDPWHPDQQVKTNADGSITLTVKAAHELEIIPRVLALGAEAEVLAPTSTRKTISQIIRKMLRNYAST